MTKNLQDQNTIETSYSKGESFEKLFAEFMKERLGWTKYAIRSQQKGKQNSKGSQVDVIAERQDKRGMKLQTLGLFYELATVVLLVIGIIDKADWLIYFGAFLSIIGLIAIIISRGLHKENAWVECKNRKAKSTYEDVGKSINEYKDYQASGDKEYKYVVHYFVSANGFVDGALKLASDNGLICYEYKNGKFELITYWK